MASLYHNFNFISKLCSCLHVFTYLTSGPAPSHLLMDMVKNVACSPLWTLPAAC